MGAMFWNYSVPWKPDPTEALRELQADYFKSNYNFAKKINELADDVRQTLKAEQDAGDPYGLVNSWEYSLQVIEAIIESPQPDDPLNQIDALRRVIETITPDGFGNILDVVAVDDIGGPRIMRRLTRDIVTATTGTSLPTREAVEAAALAMSDMLERSESICFELFSDRGEPSEWCFMGNTHD